MGGLGAAQGPQIKIMRCLAILPVLHQLGDAYERTYPCYLFYAIAKWRAIEMKVIVVLGLQKNA